jgi:hypothetical protein
MAAAGALLYGVVDPDFALNPEGLALAAGFFVAIVVTTLAFEVPIALYTRKVSRASLLLRTYPGALVVAVLFVAFSRLAEFLPGYVYGLFAGYVLMRGREMSRAEEGRSVALASISVVAVTLAAWFAWIPVKNALGENPGLAVSIADNSLCAIVVMGMETLVFGLMPFRFLDGQKLRDWSRAAWGALYGIVMLGFLHVLVDPRTELVERTDAAKATAMLVPFVLFAGLSLGFWLYCLHRFRQQRAAVS